MNKLLGSIHTIVEHKAKYICISIPKLQLFTSPEMIVDRYSWKRSMLVGFKGPWTVIH